MATPEGRAIFVSNAWQYEFDYKDHLGNTRVSFKANGNNLEKNAETAFDPFGVRLPIGVNNAFQNRFEMQGKESEKTFGLNRINLGARTINPTTGRMDRVDAMAEKFFVFTPYNYTLNNPIAIIDPDGNESGAYGGFTSQEDIELWRQQKTDEFFDRSDEKDKQSSETPLEDDKPKSKSQNSTSDNKTNVKPVEDKKTNNKYSFPVFGPSILVFGLPIIHKNIIPKTFLRSFVAQGATEWTSLSSVFFRKYVPSTLSRLSWLPKATSLGGQLGRVTNPVGVYVTTVQLIYEGYSSMSLEERAKLNQIGPGGYVPNFTGQIKK